MFALSVDGLKLVSSNSVGLWLDYQANVYASDLDFGDCGSRHIQCDYSSNLLFDGDYAISGSADIHAIVQFGSNVTISNYTVTILNTITVNNFIYSQYKQRVSIDKHNFC